MEDVKKMLSNRKLHNNKRYMKYYGVNYLDKTNYDICIDTTKLSKDEVIEKVLEEIKNHGS